MIGRALFLCVGISLLMPVTAAAEDGPRVLVSVDPSVATVGETVQYTVQLLMAGQQSARLVSNPGFGPLEVLGTNRGTEFRSTPQGSSLSYNFNFSVRGRKAGTFIIKGPKALVGGKEIEGGSVKLKLVEKGKELPASDQAGPIMVVGRFSDMKPFVGQQIQVDYTLLFDTRKVGVFGVDVVDVKSPEFDGFWIENLGQRVRTREKRRVINGRQYNVRPVQLLSVFALREGKVEIEPLELAVESSGRNSMRRSRKLVSTKAFELDVQPLPPGAPAGFHTSNVGQYSFEVATDKIKVAVGEPLLVSLIANGTGMVGRLKLPRIPAGEGYELLEPVERKKAEMVGRLVGGQKMAEVVLTPTKGGVLTIPELTLHTFDPQRGEYVSLTSKKMMVAVAGRVSKPLKKEEDVVERDASKPDALRLAQMPLRPVRPLGVRTESRSGLLGDPLFLLGLAAPPTLYLLWIGVGAWRRRRDEAAPAQHRRAAPKRASAQLGSAQGLAKKGEEAEACGLVASAMADFLSSMLEIPVGGVSEAKVRRLLEERGVAEALVAEFCVLWGVCSQARFSGEVSPPAEQVVDRARALIKALEDIG